MLFKYGYKIDQMIQAATTGDDEVGIDPINIYNPYEGANFLLKHTKQGKFFSLDGSTFLQPSSIAKDEDEFKEIWSKTYDLEEYKNSLEYESYEALERKLYHYETGVWPDNGSDESKPKEKSEPKQSVESKPKPTKAEPTPPASAKQESVVDTDDDEDFFANL